MYQANEVRATVVGLSYERECYKLYNKEYIIKHVNL